MKTRMIIFGFLYVLLTLNIGCTEKDPVDPIDPPTTVVKPTVQVLITPLNDDVMPYGTIIDVSWNAKYTYWITLNGESVDLKGSISNVRLLKDTLLSFNLSTTVSSVKKDTLIKVGDWTTSNYGLLTYHPWKIKAERIIDLNRNLIDSLRLDPKLVDEIFVFSSLYDRMLFNKPASGGNYGVILLTENELILDEIIRWNGEPAICEQFYYRP